MEKREIVKEYSNGDFTVVWKPGICIHAEICAKTLPQVYNPEARPWINAENASLEELKNQIDKCPSGALSYYTKGEESLASDPSQQTKVVVRPNGPLVVEGVLTIVNAAGETEERTNKTAFCRCGASKKKPYCDGAHGKVGFVG
ncbi:MAG: hypothetical protein DRI71_09230 [Bacteroidetes bacterium]|nr:MAG: hypothetical protein DRI71_09230 [Bacteroidota bacterium]